MDDVERIIAGPEGSCIPVYHNICGRRTLHRTCNCKVCRSPFDAATHAVRQRLQERGE